MPTLPPTACSHPLCPDHATDRGKCAKHQVKHPRSTNQAYIDRSKFYNKPVWKRVRRQVLMSEPLCRLCLADGVFTEANVVDHILPRVDGGDSLSMKNLQPLCYRCHSIKTNKENK